MANIHKLAFVHPEAKLADDVIVDPFVFIDRDVEIGAGTHIRAHASILPGARIGRNNVIYEGAIIAADPQDFRWKGEDSLVVIGDNNKIREQVIVNRSIHPGGKTTIGNKCSIMAQTHVGHDCTISDKVVLGNSVKLAGDIHIGHCAILSSGVIVHEKNNIGHWSLIKGGCRVTGNVPPYVIMAHNPISYFGVNAYVLKIGKYSDEIIDDIAKCYRHVYQNNAATYNALRRINEDVTPGKERDSIVKFITENNLKLAGVPRMDE